MRWPSPAARRTAALAVAALLLAPSVPAQADGARAQVFARLDRPVAAVGETVALEVEVLAVPSSEAALDALTAAFANVRPTAVGLDALPAGALSVQRTGRVVRLGRRFFFRAAQAGPAVLPTLAVADGLVAPARDVLVADVPPALAASAARVARITVAGETGALGFERTGAGFLVAPDMLVTAYHVVAGARRVAVHGPTGAPVRVRRAWHLDPDADIAILAVDADDARAAGLAPLPLSDESSPALSATVRDRVATLARRYPDETLDGRTLRVSANGVQPGDSGSPLLDASGAVLGVVVSGRTTHGERDLLREDVCLAADLAPVLRVATVRGQRVSLGRALAESRRASPLARAVELASAVALPQHPTDRARRLNELESLASASPAHASLQFLVGSALESAGRVSPAAEAYERARTSGSIPAAYALAHLRMQAGDADAAQRLFETVRAWAPYRHLGAMGVAQAAAHDSRYDDVDEALAEVLAHDADFGPALYLLGVSHLAQGRPAHAHALAVRLGPGSEWREPLALLLRAPALRPEALRPLAGRP